jgi:TolA-binding protein
MAESAGNMSELSRSTRALLDRGRAALEQPLPDEHRARLKRSVMARVGGASVLVAATWWSPAAAKVVGSVAVVLGLAGAGVGIWKLGGLGDAPAPTEQTEPRPAAAATVASSQAAPVAEAPDLRQLPSAAPQGAAAPPAPTPVVQATARPTPPTGGPPPAVASPKPPAVPPGELALGHATERPSAARGVGDTANPGVVSLAPPVPSPPQSLAPTSPPAPAIPAATSTTSLAARLEEEARLVRQADQALKDGDPARALTLFDEHAAKFPSGALEPERSAGRVFALCRAGRVEDARREAGQFLRTHGTGPLSARVQESCAK